MDSNRPRPSTSMTALMCGTFAIIVLAGLFTLSGCWPAAAQPIAPPVQSVQIILPIDLVELIKALFFGVALVCTPLATVYSIVSASRAKRAEARSLLNTQNISKVVDNVALIERNTNSMTSEIARLARKEGEALGEKTGMLAGTEQARLLTEAQNKGRDRERANPGLPTRPVADAPLPVVDDRAAEIALRGVEATERIADQGDKAAEDASGLSRKT